MPVTPNPADLTVEQTRQRLDAASAARDEAKTALAAADAAFYEARRLHEAAQGRQAEGRRLATLGLRHGNQTALQRVEEHVLGLHPAIVGLTYAPFGLSIDLPSEVDDEYVSELAAAMREFVRQYKPHAVADAFDQLRRKGYATAETRAGTLAFTLRRNQPAFLLPLSEVIAEESLDAFSKQIRRQDRSESDNPEETFPSLEAALTALPTAVFLIGLSGEAADRPFPRN